MRAAIYCRISTDKQTTDNQNIQLSEVAEKQGWDVQAVYAETISGATTKRPELDKLMQSVRKKEIDVVMCWDISRLSRSMLHCLQLLEELEAKDTDLYLHQQQIDTTTPMGKMVFHVSAAFAELERGMIRERVNAGLDRARKQGKRLGRPPVAPIKVRKVLELREDKLPLRQIAKQAGLSVGKVHQIISAA